MTFYQEKSQLSITHYPLSMIMINQFTVSSQWLFDHLENSDVVIIDCRFSLNDSQLGKQQYHTNHIP
ncbi:MAG: hypothetical protein ACKPGB_17485, partial [Dolichospermum sp.]